MTGLNAPTVSATYFAIEWDRTAQGDPVKTFVAELPNGVQIRLRNAGHIGILSELGNIPREIVIRAHPTTGVQKRGIGSPRIESPRVWETQWSADLYGILKEIRAEPLHQAETEFDVLDVGTGDLYLHPSVREHIPDSELPLEVGNELYVPVNLLEISDIVP